MTRDDKTPRDSVRNADQTSEQNTLPATQRASAPCHVDPWQALRRYTPARIALGRSGASMPTDEVLRFGWAHAQARDAVHRQLDASVLIDQADALGLHVLTVTSRVRDRREYLLRPDLGRRLAVDDTSSLQARNASTAEQALDLVIVAADGLSPTAVEEQGPALLKALLPLLDPGLRVGPLVIATQSRVALGDEIGAVLGARLVAVLIGERPGLSSPHSMGVYLTYAPRIGTADSARNCLSNIHCDGLAAGVAARRLAWLVHAALGRGLTGIELKDDSVPALTGPGPSAICDQ